MARRKNVKRIDPRYFLNETVNRNDDGSVLEEGPTWGSNRTVRSRSDLVRAPGTLGVPDDLARRVPRSELPAAHRVPDADSDSIPDTIDRELVDAETGEEVPLNFDGTRWTPDVPDPRGALGDPDIPMPKKIEQTRLDEAPRPGGNWASKPPQNPAKGYNPYLDPTGGGVDKHGRERSADSPDYTPPQRRDEDALQEAEAEETALNSPGEAGRQWAVKNLAVAVDIALGSGLHPDQIRERVEATLPRRVK